MFEDIRDAKEVFDKHAKDQKQILFREREVDNLTALIYGSTEAPVSDDIESEDIVDSNRFDVDKSKLELFKQKDMKKMLKSKFVTGGSDDQVVKNLLNMSDSEDEEKIDKEQLRMIE